MEKLSSIIKKFFPFWLFLTFFKFGGGLHFTVLSPLGEKILPLWLVGLLVGASAFIQLLLDVPAGYLLDRFGYKKLLKITTATFFLASIFLIFGLTKTTYLLSLGISTFGWLFFGPGITAYIAGYATEKAFGRFTSTGHVFACAGIVLSSASAAIAVMLGAKPVGIILSALFAIAFILISLSPADAPPKVPTEDSKHKQHDRMRKNFIREAWHAMVRLRPASILIMTAGFTAATFYAIIWFVVPLLIARDAAHSGVLSIGLGIFDFSVVALGFFLGKIVDSYNKKLLVGAGLFVFAVAGTFLGSNFGFLFIFLGFIATTGDELSSLALWAWLYKIDKKHENYGLISGTISLFEDIGWTVGPIVAGILYTIIGPAWTIAVGGLLVMSNLIIFLFLAKHPIPHTVVGIPKKPHRRRYKH